VLRLPSEAFFTCEVALPETDMKRTETAFYYPGSKEGDGIAAEEQTGGDDKNVFLFIQLMHGYCLLDIDRTAINKASSKVEIII
jgi:hypothetical protein